MAKWLTSRSHVGFCKFDDEGGEKGEADGGEGGGDWRRRSAKSSRLGCCSHVVS